jgi:hypothetical protein
MADLALPAWADDGAGRGAYPTVLGRAGYGLRSLRWFRATFGQTRSRRQTLRGLAGIAAARVLLLDKREAAAGKRRIGGSPCTNGRRCKTGKCVGEIGQKTGTCSAKYRKCQQPGEACEQATCNLSSKQCETALAPDATTCGQEAQCLHGCCFRAETCTQFGTSPCGNGGGGPGCFCSQTVGGEPVCYLNANYCVEEVPCDNDGDCAAGKACVDVACACGGGSRRSA